MTSDRLLEDEADARARFAPRSMAVLAVYFVSASRRNVSLRRS